MILVDTSVWIDHLHSADPVLVEMLTADEVGCHPLVESRSLWRRGLSAVDAHLLGSVALVGGSALWTRDKRLKTAAGSVGVGLVET